MPNLTEIPLPGKLLVLFSGDDEMAADFDRLIPSAIQRVRDPAASEVARLLGVDASPFVIEVESGVITGKAFVGELDDLVRLAEAQDRSEASVIAAHAREAESHAS